MDRDIQKGLDSFDRVWSRVTASLEEKVTPEDTQRQAEQLLSRGDAQQLAAFIRKENQDAARCCELMRRLASDNPMRSMLAKICSAARGRAARLQMECFLLTGDSVAQTESCAVADGMLSALREAYIAARDGEQAYLSAACRTGTRELAELFRELAAEEHEHMHLLRRLISKAMM